MADREQQEAGLPTGSVMYIVPVRSRHDQGILVANSSAYRRPPGYSCNSRSDYRSRVDPDAVIATARVVMSVIGFLPDRPQLGGGEGIWAGYRWSD